MKKEFILVSLAILAAHNPNAAAAAAMAGTRAAAAIEVPAGYAIYQRIRIDPKQSGLSGYLEILQDARVTLEYRQGWGATCDPRMVLRQGSALLEELTSHPLRPGKLRLVTSEGYVAAEEGFKVPLGRIAVAYLYKSNFPTYLVSEDYGIGMGSYAGPATMLVEIRDGRWKFVQAVENASSGRDRVWLGSSLKNAWRIVPASRGEGKEIETIQSHPNFENRNWAKTGQFVTLYSTYRFDGGAWHHKSREEIGIWEDEDAWPPKSKFP